MKYLKIYSKDYIQKLVRKRSGEIKLGDRVHLIDQVNIEKGLQNSDVKFVLLGLPEDIGVRANYGRGGTHTAWQPALTNLLNMQSNDYLSGKELLILGHIDFDDLMEKANKTDNTNEKGIDELRNLVSEIDDRVISVIKLIVSSGKIPIVVGGGHNNAYGNLKGAAQGLAAVQKIKSAKINCINCDAHSDFRSLEGRHSGNGFSYAYEEGFLNKYSVVGLHQSYTSEFVFDKLKKYSDRIRFFLFEDIILHEQLSFREAVENATDFIREAYYGIELDIDAIQNAPSSAKSSSGISANHARQYVTWAAANSHVAYLHIAEAAPILSHIKTDNKTGKLIAYLITDFIKAAGNSINSEKHKK